MSRYAYIKLKVKRKREKKEFRAIQCQFLCKYLNCHPSSGKLHLQHDSMNVEHIHRRFTLDERLNKSKKMRWANTWIKANTQISKQKRRCSFLCAIPVCVQLAYSRHWVLCKCLFHRLLTIRIISSFRTDRIRYCILFEKRRRHGILQISICESIFWMTTNSPDS